MKNKKFVFYIFTFFAGLFIFINNTFAVDITTNTTISTNTTYDSLVVKSGATLTVDASLTITGDALIEYGGIITHTQGSTTQSNLIVSGTLTINSGGKIDMNGKGIATTGAGSQTVGASHGGYGIYSNTVPYGDIYNPTSVGSYGRNTSYPGGGLVRMTVGNLVNNGSISANGSNITRGQGSGGSINITVNGNISGNGTYQANGGGTTSYNGGGGRVAIKYNTVSNLATLKSKVSAIGPKNAGEGTIYLKDLTTSYQILIIKGDGSDKGTSTSTNMNNFNEVILDFGGLSLVGSNPWNITNGFYLNSGSFLNSNSTSPITVSGTLSVSSGCILTTSGTLSVDNLLLYNGTLNSANSTIVYNDLSLSGGTINSYSSLKVYNDLNLLSGSLNSYNSLNVYNNSLIKNYSTLNSNSVFNLSGSLIIESGGIITHDAVSTSSFNMNILGTLTINSGGKIYMDGKGISTNGAGSQTVGASHGGYGINSTVVPYGDIYNPTTVGSYGRNTSYPGGGLVRMTVGNLVNNGSISANGSNLSRGQGAGGSLNITVNGNISGNGTYQANGGGTTSYNGGGGRVAIKYNSVSNLATLKSKVSAIGPKNAGEGTIYLKDLTTSYQILIIKGDGSDNGTSTSNNLNSINEIILDGGGLSLIGSYPWNLNSSFTLNNGAFLNSNSTSPITVSGTLSVSSGCILTTSGTLSVDNLLLYNGTLNSSNTAIIYNDLALSGGTINNRSNLSVYNDLTLLSGSLNSYSSIAVYNNSIIKNYSTLNNNSSFKVAGDLTIENGGIITHNVVASTSFNMNIGGTLTINSGGKIEMTGKGISTLGAGSQTVGASYGGYGINSTKAPYGDIYNPTTVGSYGRDSTTYPGGGLVRMTVGNLVNNGSILANGSNVTRGQGSGGSINITVNGNISGNGVYQANGGGTTSYNGGGGRVAIKYSTVSSLSTLKSKISATGLSSAGEGTIYLKDISTGLDYLLVKGDTVSGNYNTSVGTGYTDYYFDAIEVTNYGKLYKVGTQNIISPLCTVSGSGVIDPLINCTGDANFRYYDLAIGLKSFNSLPRKYEFLIDGPSGGSTFMTTSSGAITGNGNLSSRIKIIKVGTYNITFNIYDGNLANSQIFKTITKTLNVNK